MSDAVKFITIPCCSVSRDTLSPLKANGIDPEVVPIWRRRMGDQRCASC